MDAKLILFTNGVNILKYYDKLPLERIEEVNVSLDGIENTHLNRRYNSLSYAKSGIYDNIVSGIKRLLKDEIKVRIKTTIDKSNYLDYFEFQEYLLSEEISSSPYFKYEIGTIIDMSNKLDIDEDFVDRDDVLKIRSYFSNTEWYKHPIILSLSRLSEIIYRDYNEPCMPKHRRCDTRFFSNYYFSPNGKIYFCECFREDKGVIGTYYPYSSLDEEAALKLASRSVMNNEKCSKCAYKFVCLGNCPKSAEAKDLEMSCGVFADEAFLDNLEYNYF